MKLNCAVIDDLLPLYLDGVCSAESRALVEEHLEECPDCRKKVAALRLEEEPAPVHLEEAKSVADLARDLERKVRLRRNLLSAAAAVLLLVAVVGGWSLYKSLYHWYFYVTTVSIPLEDIELIESGVDENGLIYFELDVLPDSLGWCGWGYWEAGDAEDGTVYVSLETTRKANEAATYRDTFSTQDYNWGYSNNYDTWFWKYTYTQVDRVIYRDDDGNELVLYDGTTEE